MKKLFDTFKIRNLEIKNRICVPPMVCFNYSDKSSFVTDENIQHYKNYSQGGFGLVIVEANVIDENGVLAPEQLGIFSDEHIVNHKKITENFINNNTPVILQIHHAGVMSSLKETVSSYEYTLRDKTARELSIDEVKKIETNFINSAIRAEKAGYKGVELHAAHNYLLTQFLNSRVNKRSDEYGKDRLLIIKNIYKGIRENVNSDFIVGIRLGAFEPTLNDGINHAKLLEKIGFDYLNISSGFSFEADSEKPIDFPFSDVIYGASEIKKQVNIPVFCVNGINSHKTAKEVLEQCNVDMVCIGKASLVNQNWANDVKEEKAEGRCLYCPKCYFRKQSTSCAGRLLHQKNSV